MIRTWPLQVVVESNMALPCSRILGQAPTFVLSVIQLAPGSVTRVEDSTYEDETIKSKVFTRT